MLQLFFTVAFSAVPLTLYVPPIRSLNLFVETMEYVVRESRTYRNRVYPRLRIAWSRMLDIMLCNTRQIHMSKFHELKKEKKNHILSYCKYVFSSWTPCCGSFLIVLIFSFFLIFFDLTSIPNNLHTIKLVRCYEFVLEQFCSCRGLICSRINCCNFFLTFFTF